MNQSINIEKLLHKFGMEDCKTRTTPCEIKIEYCAEDSVDAKLYREIVGSLIYISTCTRPDITWVVSNLSRNLDKPTYEDFITSKHVLRYLKGTIKYELKFSCNSNKQLSLSAFCDSNWGNSEDRKSTSGYIFNLMEGSAPISWKTRRQPTVALSTCESEFMGLCEATQEGLYLIQFLNSFNIDGISEVLIYCDNQSAIELCKSPVLKQKSKHIDIKYHFIRYHIEKETIKLQYCPSNNMVADLFTKPATKLNLDKFRETLFGKNF